nr:glycosyltransferase family 4 protein [uncultured Holophaga sp.]
MHICHINLAKGFSGGEQQTLNLIRELDRLGVTQTLICRKGGLLHARVRPLPVLCKAVGHFLLGHATATGADLLHGHCGRSVYWATLEHTLRRTPFIITRRVDNPLGQSRATRAAYQSAAKIICVSHAIERVVQHGVGPIPTEVVPDSFSGFPIDPGEVAAIRNTWPGKLLVGQIAKLIPHKGHRVTLQAARLLRDSHPNLHFLVLGDGPLRQELEAEASDLGNITFMGHKTGIGNYLGALSLLVFPSLSEGLGSSILEAMEARVPVIASRAGGIPDLIDSGVNGLLVTPGSAEELAAAIRELADHPETAGRLVEAAAQRLPGFTPARIAERYLEIYRKLMGIPGPAQNLPVA